MSRITITKRNLAVLLLTCCILTIVAFQVAKSQVSARSVRNACPMLACGPGESFDWFTCTCVPNGDDGGDPPTLPTPTPTPTPVPPLAPKGIGLPHSYSSHCEDVGAVGAQWQYNWSYNPYNCSNVENVPMIWGANQANALLNGTATLGGNSQYILGFNEPDGQSNITPTEAARLWYQIELKYPNKKLVAPAPSHNDIYHTWLPGFRTAFQNTYGRPPRLDALAAHCYAVPSRGQSWTSCQDDIEWYEARVDEWNIPGGIWVTEYGFLADGCSTTPGNLTCNWTTAVNALNSYTDWLQTRPKVKRYAWFASRIAGNEPWWGLPTHTTRVIQCPDHPNVSCVFAPADAASYLSPFGTAYQAQ